MGLVFAAVESYKQTHMDHMYLIYDEMCHIKEVHTEIDVFTDTDFSHKRAQCTSTHSTYCIYMYTPESNEYKKPNTRCI